MLTRIGNLNIKELPQFGRDRILTTFILLAPPPACPAGPGR